MALWTTGDLHNVGNRCLHNRQQSNQSIGEWAQIRQSNQPIGAWTQIK